MSQPSLSQIVTTLESAKREIDELRSSSEGIMAQIDDLRAMAAELANEITIRKSAAKQVAKEALGETTGIMAYSLVFGSHEQSALEGKAFLTPHEQAQYSYKSNTRVTFHGIVILEKYLPEAEQIVHEALSGIENPYRDDRGKNAWRRILFDKITIQNNSTLQTENGFEANAHPVDEIERIDREYDLDVDANFEANFTDPINSFLPYLSGLLTPAPLPEKTVLHDNSNPTKPVIPRPPIPPRPPALTFKYKTPPGTDNN